MQKKHAVKTGSDTENIRQDQIVYMDNPSLFLHLFCSGETDASQNRNQQTGSRKKRIFRTVPVLLTVAVALGISSAVWFPLPLIKEMVADGRSDKNAAYAEARHSEDIPDPVTAESLALAITEKGWADRIREGRFDEAGTILAEQSAHVQEYPEHQRVLTLFGWVTEMEKYFSGRLPESPLIIFCDEYRIESLLSVWEKNKTEFRSLLKQLGEQDVPGLFQDRMYQLLEILRKRQILYVKDIQIFKEDFRQQLEEEKYGNPLSLIEDFRKKHPGIGGMEELYRDTVNYMKIMDAVKIQQWDEAAALLHTMAFHTDFFIRKIELLQKNEMICPQKGEARQMRSAPPSVIKEGPVNISRLRIMSSDTPSDTDDHRIMAWKKVFRKDCQ
ncbi:MAG: hypothetical protein R2941_20760 [Desulfobacterales bacterium]